MNQVVHQGLVVLLKDKTVKFGHIFMDIKPMEYSKIKLRLMHM